MTMQLITPLGRRIRASAVIVAVLSVQACAPTRPPVGELDNASRALGAARAADAASYAPAEYRVAGQRFDEAQAAEGNRDYDAAIQLASESAVDSELAIARTRLAKARQVVDRLRQDNAGLDRDLTEHASSEAQP